VSPDELLDLFDACAAAQRAALATLHPERRRGRTDKHGQYALDLVADEAILPLLHAAGLRVLSEESGWTGPEDAAITVVLDPVDGSTNCSREIPYWSISLCAIDSEGPLAALVTNSATGQRNAAIRGGGATCDRRPIQTSTVERIEDSVIAVSGRPKAQLPWKQFRALGSSALTLCDVAAGRLDAFCDSLVDGHRPWDYLGGLLICQEAGAVVRDFEDRPLVTTDHDARRRLLAASTPALADALAAALR